jgi:YbgC/YbaW family acyl-CoA thioester hydrolase
MSPQLPFTHAALRTASTVHHRVHARVRFQDVDAAGTVFYPRYFDYLADASSALLAARGVDVPAVVNTRTWLAPLRHVEAEFYGPLRFGDPYVIDVVALHAGETSYGFGCRVSADDGSARVLATLFVVHVCIDPVSFRPAPLPEVLRAALAEPAATMS